MIKQGSYPLGSDKAHTNSQYEIHQVHLLNFAVF